MRKLSVLLLSVVSVALVGHLFMTDAPTETAVYEDRLVRTPSQEFGSEPLVSNSVVQRQKASEPVTDPWVYEAVKMQTVDVSNAYAENIRYPTYSKPLHENDWAQLNPRPFIEKGVPMGFDVSITAAIVLEHYIVNLGEDLPVEVKVVGESNVSEVLVYLQNDSDKKHAVSLSKISSEKASITYSGLIPSSTLSDYEEREILILSDITFSNSEKAQVSAVFKLVGTDATLLELGEA